ncbi:MAG: NAD-binding protein [Candidatus Ornithospirochaeta sp.]
MNLFNKTNTKRKNAIIAGCGGLGARIAGELSLDDWSVTVLDISSKAFRSLPQYYGGETRTGSATDFESLEKAGIKDASLFIASTDSDEVNIVASQMAKTVYDVDKVLARIRDQEKSDLLEPYGISVVCPPTLSIREIHGLLGGKDEA